VYDDELTLIGAAHVARGHGYAEVGVSVLAGHRGRGIGNALLARSRLHARNWGLAELFTHCASDNRAMMQLAKKHGMRTVVESGEADAFVDVPAPDPSSYAAEMLAERVGAFDHAMKTQWLNVRRMAEALRPSYLPT
jgi:GNAT superfamily N-acetyltransferase